MEQPKPYVDLPLAVRDLIFAYYYAPKIVCNLNAARTNNEFRALFPDGALHKWTAESYGGVIDRIQDITAAASASAAITWDGDIIAWGNWDDGGRIDEKARKTIADARASGFYATDISRTSAAFAALFSDGSVVTWGHSERGGNSSDVQGELKNVVKIYGNAHAFAALRRDGRVVTWGNNERGGNSSDVKGRLENVVEIYSNAANFAALRQDGSVVTWGFHERGGNGGVITWGGNERGGNSSVLEGQLKNVVKIYSNAAAFAALRNDGSVVTWGKPEWGGNSSAVSHLLDDVESVYSHLHNFVALRKDGRVVTWGAGGSYEVDVTGVVHMCATAYAVVALTDSGRLFTLAPAKESGMGPTIVHEHPIDGILSVSSTPTDHFIARRYGSVVIWARGPADAREYKMAGNTAFREVINKHIFGLERDESCAAITTAGDIVVWGGIVTLPRLQTVDGMVWPGIQHVLDKKPSIKKQFDIAFGHPPLS